MSFEAQEQCFFLHATLDDVSLLVTSELLFNTVPWEDTYKAVLTKAPQAGETVTVNLIAEPTRAQRGGGEFGIRSFTEQVELSVTGLLGSFGVTQQLNFDTSNWFVPQDVDVRAIDDAFVDGGQHP